MNPFGRRWRIAAGFLLLLGSLFVVCTAKDYGVSYDEQVQAEYGRSVLRYFLSWGKDTSCNSVGNLYLYGAGFELAVAAVTRFVPDPQYVVHHAATAITGIATVLPLIWMGLQLRRPWLGILASILLLTMPSFWGHIFVNSKDIPFAFTYAVVMAVLTWVFICPARLGAGVWMGVSLAAMLSVRPAGILAILPPLGALLCHGWIAGRGAIGKQATPWKALALGLLLGWAIMLILWPYTHASPILRPVEAIRIASSFNVVFPMLYRGKVVMSDRLPWDYLPTFIAITTPIPTLLCFGVGIVAAVRELARRRCRRASVALIGSLCWTMGPVLLFVVLRPNIYDGMRHFLFVLPGIAFVAAFGLVTVLRATSRGRTKILVGLLMVVGLVPNIAAMVRLHPYEMTYYNEFVGGLSGAAGRFETDYWHTSFREAIEWVNTETAARGDVCTVLLVLPDCARDLVAPFAAPNVRLMLSPAIPSRLPPGCRYYIGTTRGMRHMLFPEAPIVHVVGRERAPFAVIRELPPERGSTQAAAETSRP